MDRSWKCFRQCVKSRWSALAGGLWRSRERLAEKCRRLQRQVGELRKQIRDLQSEGERERKSQQVVLDELREQHRQWEQDRRVLDQSPPRLPEDPPLGTHGYGPRMILLCVNVAQKVGLRGTQAVLRIVFEWLRRKLEERAIHLFERTTQIDRQGREESKRMTEGRALLGEFESSGIQGDADTEMEVERAFAEFPSPSGNRHSIRFWWK